MMALIRLDKILSDAGVASRREAKAYVKAGRVTVDGITAASADDKYDPVVNVVCLDGECVDHKSNRYIMMNKPEGVLSATEDSSQQTVVDLLSPQLRRQGLFPVGRLDKDTTGLLILTNDGDFSHNIISPRRHVAKIYRAAVNEMLDESDVAAFAEGLTLADGTKCLPAKLIVERPYVGVVTVYEGKYHQVKRMFASRGKYVTALHRMQIGSLELDKALEPGAYRELSAEEIEKIFS